MNLVNRHISMALFIGCTSSIIVLYAFRGTAAEKQSVEPSLSELVASSDEYSKPHGPFWLSTKRVGFITEKKAQTEQEGGVYSIDLQTKQVTTLLNRDVVNTTFLRKSNRLAFVSIGRNSVLTVFTKPLDKNDVEEYDLGTFAVFNPCWTPDTENCFCRGKL
jgi:Tol biopolymer transport system component